MNDTLTNTKSAILEIPKYAREVVAKIIDNPRFLQRLLINHAEIDEAYAAEPPNKNSYSRNYDAYNNPVTVEQDCLSRARFYRRVAKELSLPEKNSVK